MAGASFSAECLFQTTSSRHWGRPRHPLDVWGFAQSDCESNSLLVRLTSVVEDPSARTILVSGAGTPMGKWTFGFLMTQIANKKYTGCSRPIRRQWVELSRTGQTVNGWSVGPFAITGTRRRLVADAA